MIVDLGSLQKINVVRIAWAEPYAKDYRVQFWSAGEDSPRRNATKGIWQTFPAGLVTNGQGGDITIRLTSLAVSARYLRVWMMESSNTCDTHGSGDPRNCVGYAIRELYAGILAANGTLQDLVKHVAGGGQSRTVCSSVDPWHTPSDINERGGDQVGFDFFYTSGITRGLPAMRPVAMLLARYGSVFLGSTAFCEPAESACLSCLARLSFSPASFWRANSRLASSWRPDR